MFASTRILVLIFLLTLNVTFAFLYQPYKKTEDPIYVPQHLFQPYKKPEVHLHKLCTWNVLEWENPVIKDASNDNCNLNCESSYIPSANIPTAFAFYNDTVFVGVRRRRGSGIYSTLNYFKLCDIVDKKCPKLRPYPSFESTELLSEECSRYDQVISVERFSVDRCINDPKLWIFDTRGVFYKNTPYSFGEPALKVFRLSDNTLLRSRALPSNLYNRNTLGIVQVIVYVVNNDESCDMSFAYLIDATRGSLIVYSWNEDRFWRFDSPKFYGDSKYSDFSVTTPSDKRISYFPVTHIYEATVDLYYKQLLYHARGSLSAYSIDLDTVNHSNTTVIGPTQFGVTYLGERNKKGQTGSQAINNELCAVWGIQEQNYAITCYNRRRPLTPGAMRIVISDKKQLPFLVDLKMEKAPKYCVDVDDKVYKKYYESFKEASHDYSHQYSNNWIYVLTNNEKDIEDGNFDPTYENFGIYYIKEDDALKVHPECLPQYKEEYLPPTHNRKPYMPPKPVTEEIEPVQEQVYTNESPPVTYEEAVDTFDASKNRYLNRKQYQAPPPRKPTTPVRYNDKFAAYEIHRTQYPPNYPNPKYDPYYYNIAPYQNRYSRTSNQENDVISFDKDETISSEVDNNGS